MYSRTLTPPEELIHKLLQTPFHPHYCEVNGKPLSFMRLEVPFEVSDYLGWLKAQTLFPKVYWESPQEEMKVAAIGKAYEVSEIPSISEHGGPRFFGGQDFLPRTSDMWSGFPNRSYFLPLIEIEERDGITFLTINRMSEDLPAPLNFEENGFEVGKPISRIDSPTYPLWEQYLKEILGSISGEEVTKVVAARCTRFDFEDKPCPYSILKELKNTASSSTLFAFQFEEDKAFIGASPETLYRREEALIESSAVAGTRPRGNTAEADESYIDALLNSPKELHEFNVVKESIENSLSPLCQKLHSDEGTILQTATVQHIHHTFKGLLKKGVTDKQLIEALHPTPAVGGLPKPAAADKILSAEPFDRGWYAAPIGWISQKRSHHIVAIRSALIDKHSLYLFAGAGIVAGSNPLNEWNELEHKISQFLLWEHA